MNSRRITTKFVISDMHVIGLLFFTLVSLILFFNQEWGFGSYILFIPITIGIFAFIFRIVSIMRPNAGIQGVPIRQYPLGDENYLQSLFMFGFVITMFLIISLGYEFLISSSYFNTVFDLFMFLLCFIYLLCFHVAINKIWLTARIELDFRGETGTNGYDDKTYTIWGPSQVQFDKFTILNIVIFISLLLLNVIELIVPEENSLIALPLPRVYLEEDFYHFPVLILGIFIIDPVFFVLVLSRIYNDIYDLDVDKIIPSVVKIEDDDDKRERIIRFLEKLNENGKMKKF
ncbi:MAG: hypothetical protein ACTSUE_27570 [Promethearchaeota archaeon]